MTFGVLVFSLRPGESQQFQTADGKTKTGQPLPDAITRLLATEPADRVYRSLRVSKDGAEGYLLLIGDWSGRTVPGAEIFQPFDSSEAARAFIDERGKKWTTTGRDLKNEVQ